MALVKDFNKIAKHRNMAHEPVECAYTIFDLAGHRYLQIDTFGSRTRRIKNKVSQAVQFDEESAAKLRAILDEAFRKP